jgi:hypothetical protein
MDFADWNTPNETLKQNKIVSYIDNLKQGLKRQLKQQQQQQQ